MEGLDMSAFWLDRPTLVTGATGLVGSWLVRELVRAHAEVVCLVRDWVPDSESVRSGTLANVRVVRGDVRDQELMVRTVGEYEIDTVFHLAAQTVVGIANRDPGSTLDTNIRGTWQVIEACRRIPTVKQLIVASSDKAYGDQPRLPSDEATPLDGHHPYDVSKVCADLVARSYALTYGVPVAVTRCGNFFGGGDLNWNRLVPGTIRAILRGNRPVIRSDGHFVRDYLYVEDAVAAYMLLAERLAADPSLKGEAFNFSLEVRLTVLRLVDLILKLTGSDLRPEVRNETLNEIREQSLSSEKARRILGWRPLFTMEEGLRNTITWYRAFLEND